MHFCRKIRNMIFRKWERGKGHLDLLRKFIHSRRMTLPLAFFCADQKWGLGDIGMLCNVCITLLYVASFFDFSFDVELSAAICMLCYVCYIQFHRSLLFFRAFSQVSSFRNQNQQQPTTEILMWVNCHFFNFCFNRK